MFPICVCISINQKQIAKLTNIHAPSHIPPSSFTCKHFEAETTFPSGLCTNLRQWSHNPALGFLVPAGVIISFLKQNNICNIISTIPLVRARHPGKDWSLVSNPEAYAKECHLLMFLLVVLVSYLPFTPGATLWSNNPAMRLLPVAGVSPQHTPSNHWSHRNSLQIHCRDTV